MYLNLLPAKPDAQPEVGVSQHRLYDHGAMAPEIATSSATTSMTDVAISFSNIGSTFHVFTLPAGFRNRCWRRRMDNSMSRYVSDGVRQRLQIDDGYRHVLDFALRIEGHVNHHRQAFVAAACLPHSQLSQQNDEVSADDLSGDR
jgi:hypothetical protein